MTVYLLDRAHHHLITFGADVALVFLQAALEDVKWLKVVRGTLGGLLHEDVLPKLASRDTERQDRHPKIEKMCQLLLSFLRQPDEKSSAKESPPKQALVLCKSALLFQGRSILSHSDLL